MFLSPLSRLLLNVPEAQAAAFFTAQGAVINWIERDEIHVAPEDSVEPGEPPLQIRPHPRTQAELKSRLQGIPLTFSKLCDHTALIGGGRGVHIEYEHKAWSVYQLNDDYALALLLPTGSNLPRAMFWLRQAAPLFKGSLNS